MTFDLNAISEQIGIDALQEQAEKDSNKRKDFSDPRMWKPTFDDAGNAYARIRFLPPPKGEPTAWIKFEDHFFKGPTGLYYVENSLKTLGKECPVQEYQNTPGVWPKDDDFDAEKRKIEYRKRKARTNYIFNIYVIEDKKNPDAEGKVWLYRTGTSIFDMIQSALKPEFPDPDEKPVPVFDFLTGADFKVKAYTENNFVKYDKSGFEAPSKFLGGDAKKIEPVYNSMHSLQEFISADKFKSYDELKTKLYRVLALNVNGEQTVSQPVTSPEPTQGEASVTAAPEDHSTDSEDDSSGGMAYFKGLAEKNAA